MIELGERAMFLIGFIIGFMLTYRKRGKRK